jgi:hypothetical protein
MKVVLNSFVMLLVIGVTFLSGSSRSLLGKAGVADTSRSDGAGGHSGGSCN